MKKKWPVLILTVLVLAMLFLPAVKLHVHAQLGEEIAAAFPSTLSLWDMMVKGSAALPLAQVPEMAFLHFGSGMLIAGCVLLVLGCAVFLSGKKGSTQISAVLTACSAVCFGAQALHVSNLSSSLLFTVLLTTQAVLFLPLALTVVILVLEAVMIKGQKPLLDNDGTLRLISGVLAVLALLVMLLPVYTVSVPETLTASPADARAMNRSVNLYTIMLGQESNLYAQGADQGVYTDVLSGDMAALEKYSADANNIKGIFTIRNNTGSMNAYVLGGAVLLLIAAALSFIRKVDRWFPITFAWIATILLAVASLSILTVGGQADMYSASSRQLILLGVGCVTPVPFIAALCALGSALAGSLGVKYANEPYFVNPIPAASRLRFVAVVLAVLSIACILLPGGTVAFSKAGKNKVQATAEISGIDALTMTSAQKLADPVDSKGKAVYAADDETFSAAAVNEATARTANYYNMLTWASLIVAVLGLLVLLLKKNQKLGIALFLVAFVLRAVTWLALSRTLPREVAIGSGTLWLYVSLPLLVFSAFFTNFVHLDELPKKYKLFLMMLPFLVAVFLFSYLPLYGWSYAFYNYKFGVSMDQQEFVGLKWFTEMFTNEANRINIVRVLKNTFGMSSLNLLTSWLPMIFAIFLNEITQTRFKKFVQIFTTLPNFISWALVFSFAMCLFAMDTGIFSKFMEAIGAIPKDSHIVWLNSSEHIWLKMWGWNTWKGLGWGAIMYLAAISGIDQELYEAAQVDGANRWHKMRYITLPGLLPTFFVLLMLSISNILNNGMEQYLVFQNPMNKNSIEVLDLYVYNITIASRGTTLYSYATAIGILKTIVSVTLLFSANFASKKLRGESIM